MTSNTSLREARELYELKEKAAKYYAENGVPQKMEDILNSMFYDNPSDVYGHLVSSFADTDSSIFHPPLDSLYLCLAK